MIIKKTKKHINFWCREMSFHRVSGRKSIFHVKTHLRWAPSAEKPSVWYRHPQHLKGRIQRGSCSTNNTCLPTWGDKGHNLTASCSFMYKCVVSHLIFIPSVTILFLFTLQTSVASLQLVDRFPSCCVRWRFPNKQVIFDTHFEGCWSNFFSLTYINKTASRTMTSQCESETSPLQLDYKSMTILPITCKICLIDK